MQFTRCIQGVASINGGPTWSQLIRRNGNFIKKSFFKKTAQSHHESFGTYGSPRILEDLKAQGYSICEQTMGRYMKELELCALPVKQFVTTTDSNHNQFIPNLLERQFNVDEPNTAWVSDITYIWTLEGWLYLESMMDLFSSKIVGWSLDVTMKTELPLGRCRRRCSCGTRLASQSTTPTVAHNTVPMNTSSA